MRCGCQCSCPTDSGYHSQSNSNFGSMYHAQLSRKPTIENGWTTDRYDDSEFVLTE